MPKVSSGTLLTVGLIGAGLIVAYNLTASSSTPNQTGVFGASGVQEAAAAVVFIGGVTVLGGAIIAAGAFLL
jgi:hypothetical protein